mmetsp:Transcript_9016/g.18003  ORF Transcript_9016/g.18003 Transcript_9016/m.18003 type:complete len:791 (-) Transcript_9016:130-2502(-)|eukprot:CAMPEP_0181291890 /NCGR_PEP_ID=MMETSP1101-20121128/2211_1 /TAXON_ID=46948 /ORGANISM="Rhodomonas abbreviata, Strain Caron Lab Isolate" /LENGTH=790 /DNA_ID=CAMNT_0023396317 /DNA_START=106 /DNA_END=2478 /DNA_ORIENTATION=+
MENLLRKRQNAQQGSPDKKQGEEKDGSSDKKQGLKADDDKKSQEQEPIFELECADGAGIAGMLVMGMVLLVYVLTMYPSVPGGDSGELIVAGCTVGIAHPPGYPLFTMLAVLFHGIPFGNPAWRINLLSVLLSTGGAFLVFKTVVLWDSYETQRAGGTKKKDDKAKDGVGKSGEDFPARPHECWNWSVSVWAGMLASLMLAFCPLMWMYSIQAEVFAMNNFFVALLLYLTVSYHVYKTDRLAQLGAFSIGLGLSNQHTIVFYAFPLVLCILWTGRHRLFSPLTFLSLILCGLLGLTPYIYLPLAGREAGFGAWGEMDTVDGFLTHFLRKEYGTFRLYSGNDNSQMGDQLWQALDLYARNLVWESTLVVGAALVVVGFGRTVVAMLKKGPGAAVGFAILFAFTFYMIVFHCLSNLPLDQPLYFGVHMRFWMQGHIVAFCWMGLGAATVWRVCGTAQRVTALLTTLALVGTQLGMHYRSLDQSDNQYVRLYGLMHLESLPKDAILVVKGDVITNSIRYLQRCESVRPDVQHLDQSMMTYEWFTKKQARHFRNITFPNLVYNPYKDEGYSMELFLETNALDPARPAFLCGGWYHDEVPAHLGGGIPGFKTWPVGPCDRIRAEEDELSLPVWVEEAESMTPHYNPPPEGRYTEDTWERVTLTDYWAAKHKLPYALLTWAIENGDDQEALQQAGARFEDLIAEHSNPPDYFFKNAGITFGRLRLPGNHCKMIANFARFLVGTTEGPEHTKDIVKIIKDYLVHLKQVKAAGVKADCDADTINNAKRAYKRYKPPKK